MEDKRLVQYTNFNSRLDEEMRTAQRECERITRFFQEARHVEEIRGSMEDEDSDKNSWWKKHGKERMKTVSVAIVLCLHIGIDPPDAPPRIDPCARKLAWIDPHHCGAMKASHEIGESLQKSYERWQPRAKIKIACDPPLDDVRKIATNLRRVSGADRILFHYNGHGVPKPTENGEIWVFNKSFTQYIPLSLYDLQSWLEFPAVYVWECHSAETIIKSFQRFSDDHIISWQSQFDKWQEEEATLPAISSNMSQAEQAEAMGFTQKFPQFQDCIHLAACQTGEFLPMADAKLPADLFTSCLTSPVQTAILWYLIKSERNTQFPDNILDLIPGNLGERRTVLGELNWIFTAITDTIAFTSIDREVFQKLFRQDLLLASLFRSFLLAQRVMSDYDVLPVSWPRLKNTSEHELWACWDSTLDMVLDYVRELIYVKKSGEVLTSGREILLRSNIFPFLTLVDFDTYINVNDNSSNWFFIEQLQAFELWLDYGIDKGTPPLQLPVVLQVLLSQQHRVRALKLLARFLDFGRWAVGYSLSVGIFPYVLRLLQSSTKELRPSLCFIWAKILAVDPSCQQELFKENGDDSGPAPPTNPQQNRNQQSLPQTSYANGNPPQMDRRVQNSRYQNELMQRQQYQQQQQQQQMKNMHASNKMAAQPPVKKKEGPLRYLYFVSILNDENISSKQKIVPAFVLAMLTHNNYKKAQEILTEHGFVNLCTEMLMEPKTAKCRMLKLWLLIGLGRLWSDYNNARWQAVRLVAYDKVIKELEDDAPEVRAAAVFALGSLLKNASQANEHAAAIDEELADELCNRCVFDGSVLVREELIVALQWFVFDFELRFVKLLLELMKTCKIAIPQKFESMDDEEGVDIASRMTTMRSRMENVDFTQPTMNRKKMSTSVFNTAVEEDVLNDSNGAIYPVGYDVGVIEREPEDIEFRRRTAAQIKHLESKTFNEPIARTWLALLRLSLDPIEHVARMAQKIVRRVENGTHKMKTSITDKLLNLNRTWKNGDVRFGKSKFSDMAQQIKNDLSEEQTLKEVKFQVGSPGIEVTILNPPPPLIHRAQESASKIDKNNSNQGIADMDDLHSLGSLKSGQLLGTADFAEVMAKSFTPKRRTVGPGDFSKPIDSKTLRTVIENPIVTTQFVPWCSRIFVEPILHLLDDDPNQEDRMDDSILTKTSPSDWAIHALEGMRQSADIEAASYKSTRYDHCLWKVNLTHAVSSLVTSKLRRCMYASDGRMVTIIRQDVDARLFRKFDLTDNNPFNQENVSQMILMNEMSREMLLACSRNGVVRIWDPFFTTWSEDYENPPQLVSSAFPLADQMKLSDGSHRCLFDWNQSTGRILCTGPRSVRIWDAHYEKTLQDIMYQTSVASSGVAGKHDKNALPTAMSGDLDEMGNLVAIGYSDGNVDVFDMRMLPRQRAMQMSAMAPSTFYEQSAPSIMCLQLRKTMSQNYLFAGNRDGVITKWEPRMYREPTSQIEASWPAGSHSAMYVHSDARMMASASGSNLVIYDVASSRKMANVSPPLQDISLERKDKSGTFAFLKSDSQRKMSQHHITTNGSSSTSKIAGRIPKITALTMHQMRLMTVVGYDDNSVCVYGSLKPGLTACYENVKQ